MDTDLSKYAPLREEQRLQAREKAREKLKRKLGGEPRLEDYERTQSARFGTGAEMFVLIICGVVFFAAFIISAIHIYTTIKGASRATNLDYWTSVIISGAFVLLAESAILALTLVPTVWKTPRLVNICMYAGVLGAAFIAAVGNINAAILYTTAPFSWLENWIESFATQPERGAMATLPPVLTVLVGQGLKYYALHRAEIHNEARYRYEEALHRWEQQTGDLERHPLWRDTYAFALWDAWRMHKKPEHVNNIPQEDREAIVLREMTADRFFTSEISQHFTEISPEIQRNEGKNEQSPREVVINHLLNYPDDINLRQADLAAMLGVSAASVNRAIKALNSNGHNNGNHH